MRFDFTSWSYLEESSLQGIKSRKVMDHQELEGRTGELPFKERGVSFMQVERAPEMFYNSVLKGKVRNKR